MKAGDIIRYDDGLWRVDFVSDFRTRIEPLGKTNVPLEGGAVNISSNSVLEVVTDIERARDQLELEAVEREIVETKRALAAATRSEEADRHALAEAEREVAEARAALAAAGGDGGAGCPATARRLGGWRVGPVPPPAFREGTLAAAVWACIHMAPGRFDTKTLVDIVKADGNVTACVSRFNQAGYITKE